MQGVEIGLGILLVIALVLIVLVVIRRRVLSRSGAIDISWRDRFDPDGGGWYLGLARFEGEHLLLYRWFSPFPIANRKLRRQELTLGARRGPVGEETELLPIGATIARCSHADRELELALSPDAVTGLLAWLEAVPPSDHSTGRLRRTG